MLQYYSLLINIKYILKLKAYPLNNSLELAKNLVSANLCNAFARTEQLLLLKTCLVIVGIEFWMCLCHHIFLRSGTLQCTVDPICLKLLL